MAIRHSFPAPVPSAPNRYDVDEDFEGRPSQHDVDVDAGQFADAIGELSLADLARGTWPINSEYDLRCMLAAELERIVRAATLT